MPADWPAFVDLFGPKRGACGGCWCMWPRLRGVDFKAMDKESRKLAFQSRITQGPSPGLLAFEGAQAIGWVAIEPRAGVRRFNNAKPSRLPEEERDQDAIWGITCFYIRNTHRGTGLMARLAEAAVEHARACGARAVDICPIEPNRPLIWGEGFVGIAPVFPPLGFVEIARRSPNRPLLRKSLT